MLTPEKIKLIAEKKNIEVKRSSPGLLVGKVLSADEKKYCFTLTHGEDYVYLRLKTDNQEILDVLRETIGRPYLRAENRRLTRREIIYCWNTNQNKRDELFNLVCTAIAKSHFFGWQNVKRMSA